MATCSSPTEAKRRSQGLTSRNQKRTTAQTSIASFSSVSCKESFKIKPKKSSSSNRSKEVSVKDFSKASSAAFSESYLSKLEGFLEETLEQVG